MNKFIIGDILNEILENRKFNYYLIFLFYDANEVPIYWQVDSRICIINVRYQLPTLNDLNFAFLSLGYFAFILIV